MEDTTDDVECWDILKTLYRQCQPHYVITVAGMPVHLINALKKMAMRDIENEESTSSSSNSGSGARDMVLQRMCKREHNFNRCFHRVRCLQLEFEPKGMNNTGRLSFLNSLLNFNCWAMIHALGSLLLFIDKSWNSIALDPAGRARFVSLNYITL